MQVGLFSFCFTYFKILSVDDGGYKCFTRNIGQALAIIHALHDEVGAGATLSDRDIDRINIK